MAFNIPTKYKDLNPAPELDKATLNKMVMRSCNLQGSFNYERMQAAGWLNSITPGLEKIHTNKEDLAASMAHNLEFFNTHPFLVTFVMGIVLSLEQNKADIPTIRAVRVAAMGPLGGIGDALFWFTLVPITAGITANMALEGSFAAPIIFLLVFNIVQFLIRFWLMNWSYKLGAQAIEILTENAREFTRAASILGVFIVGALTSNYGATKIGLKIPKTDAAKAAGVEGFLDAGSKKFPDLAKSEYIDIQGILDGVLPMLLPLIFTLGIYTLLAKKKWKPVQCIGLLMAIALVFACLGNFFFKNWGPFWG